MKPSNSILLNKPLEFPIEVIKVEGVPTILAGGIPVVPINVVIQKRQREGATTESLERYVCAATLYLEFAAHLNRSLIEITNEEFVLFKEALQGHHFQEATGNIVRLSGKRIDRTSDLMITLMYSLATDIEEIYGVQFDWRRYQGKPRELVDSIRALNGFWSPKGLRRAHRLRWRPKKVLGLPDDQFILLLKAAYERWGDMVADGDIAYAPDPESQRGALFYRNAAILLILRFEGGRRSEVSCIEFDDVDQTHARLYLVTKGHGGVNGERLPVVLFPAVYDVIWHYVTRFRPVVNDPSEEEKQLIFLSHSVQNYGRSISAQSVRKMLDALRPALSSPWDKLLSPHMLRHSYAYDIQRFLGEAGLTVNMRHSSPRSSAPYAAGLTVYADELLKSANSKVRQMLAQVGLNPDERKLSGHENA